MVGSGLEGAPTSIQQSMDVAVPGFRDRLHNINSEVCNVSHDVTQIDAKVRNFKEKQDAINGQLTALEVWAYI